MKPRLLALGLLAAFQVCYLEFALIGILATNARIGLSTLPFLTLAGVHFVTSRAGSSRGSARSAARRAGS